MQSCLFRRREAGRRLFSRVSRVSHILIILARLILWNIFWYFINTLITQPEFMLLYYYC